MDDIVIPQFIDQRAVIIQPLHRRYFISVTFVTDELESNSLNRNRDEYFNKWFIYLHFRVIYVSASREQEVRE